MAPGSATRKKTTAGPVRRRTAKQAVTASQNAETPQRRERILHAAAELFATHGYHGVSVRDIAQRAKVPLALCTYYFSKKYQLFMALFEYNISHMRAAVEALEAVSENLPRQAALERVVRAWVEPTLWLLTDPHNEHFARLYNRALLDPAEEAQAAIRKYIDPVTFALLRALRKIYPQLDPANLAWGYTWACGALQMHTLDHRVERISAKQAKHADMTKLDLLVEVICACFNTIGKSR